MWPLWGAGESAVFTYRLCTCYLAQIRAPGDPDLREAGLVRAERRGTTICYSLARDQLAQLADRLGGIAATAAAGHQARVP